MGLTSMQMLVLFIILIIDILFFALGVIMPALLFLGILIPAFLFARKIGKENKKGNPDFFNSYLDFTGVKKEFCDHSKSLKYLRK